MVESKENKIIKKVNFLKTKKGRDLYNQFIIEGEKFVFEIPADFIVESILISNNYYENKKNLNIERNTEVIVVKDNLFRQISDTVSPQGILAIVNKKQFNYENLPLENGFFLIAEDLQDPGNMGTLIRTADAAGVDCLFTSKLSVDIYNSKVIRATAGSIFHLPIIENCDIISIIDYFTNNNVKILAGYLKGNKYPYEIDMTENLAIVIGNEGNGISDEITMKASYLLKIPMIGLAESLNASIANGILLYEVVRQRINNI